MSKITKTAFLRKVKGINLDVNRKVHWAEYKGIKFPVLMSPGQIVNIKKAYEKWTSNKSK